MGGYRIYLAYGSNLNLAQMYRRCPDSMLLAVVGFFLSYWIFREPYGVQSLWVGYMVHLVVRTVYLSVAAKKEVFEA